MSNDFTNLFSALLGKYNSSMLYTMGSECWKVIVIGIDDVRLRQCVRDNFGVRFPK
jgi:hypothetical protein